MSKKFPMPKNPNYLLFQYLFIYYRRLSEKKLKVQLFSYAVDINHLKNEGKLVKWKP